MDKYNREILQLALPSVVSNITVPLLGLVDVAIAGHIGDATYIGAIAIGSMISISSIGYSVSCVWERVE